MTTHLFSEAGKVYEKCQKIRPMNKTQRQRSYASCEITPDSKKKSGTKMFSPFNTVSRQNRDSYLLRVTHEPNTQTNYELNFGPILKKERRSTIDRAKFKRIIGPVNDRDYSIEFGPKRDEKCGKSFTSYSKSKPLTTRETHKWRKTLENLDFKKQINPERTNAVDFMKTMKSTKDSFMAQTLRETTESNFNNYKRFSFVSRPQKSHDFKSDSAHQYLKTVLNRQIQPEYDIMTNKEEFFRMSMKKPQGQMRFDLNRDKITTRVDRADPHWVQNLEYLPEEEVSEQFKTISFDLTTDRKPNEVHSKYPIRQSLKPYIPLNKAQ